MRQVQLRSTDHGPELVFPSAFNIVTDLIDRHPDEGRGAKAAILCLEETVSYATLAEEVNRYGNTLLSLGLQPGDRLLMLIRDAPEFHYVFWGSIKVGIIPVPLNTMLVPADIGYIVDDSAARGLVYSEEYRGQVQAAIDDRNRLEHLLLVRHGDGCLHDLARAAATTLGTRLATAHDDCFWLYSSGTTGRPKGVVHAHRDIAAVAQHYSVDVLGGLESDVFYSIAKLFFAKGVGCGMAFPLWVGATAVLDARRPTPAIAADLMRRFAPTIFGAVPTFLVALLASGQVTAKELGNLRRCISGGEALPEELQRRWLEVAPIPITEGIGSTETLHIYISNRITDIRPNCSGRIVPGYQARILDQEGTEILDDRPGRLWIKGPSVTSRYWNNPERTAAAIVDGWIDTGDTFHRDADGYYYYGGRSDDMLKVGGIWVSPFEIEGTLISHPAVLEAAVVGRADDAGMIKPEAWLILRDGRLKSASLADEIRDFCKRNLAPYKYPRSIHFIEQLPKTATGKIQRFKLRAARAPH